MKLKDFWPAQQRVNECIRTEAETLPEAVFLAIHQPVSLIRQATNAPGDKKILTEKDLLAAFLSENLPSGNLLLPILGSSGIGKSHMIRWLDAQLRKREDAKKRHIIRIPKSASLKRVLSLILNGLEGEEYDAVRETLETARENLDELAAVETLRAKLKVALERENLRVQAVIAEARNSQREPSAEDHEIAAHTCQAGLQALLYDNELSVPIMQGRLSIIARGFTQDVTNDEGTKNQFEEKDLVLPDTVNLGFASRSARTYYRLINRENGNNRTIAVNLLNKVIDTATNQLVDLGGNSLSDLFVRVREQLLREGKELILLVEDFADLVGVQGALLNAMIKEAVRDGEQVLCTMRTALAVTEGYITNRETVATRAIYEWKIDDVPYQDDQLTINAIADFVGRYLNAARIGQKELERLYQKSDDADLLSWIPSFGKIEDLTEEERNQLEAFGKSQYGHPLFPFNRAAIRQLAYRYLKNHDGDLMFNPRFILNKILRDTLLPYRTDLLQHRFPPSVFHNIQQAELDAQVRVDIQNLSQDQDRQHRYNALLRFWGDNPSSLSRVSLPREVYTAFGLEPLTSIPETGPTGDPEDVVGEGPGGVSEGSPRPEPRNESKNILLRQWRETLNKWAQGTEILQAEANDLRKCIAAGLSNYIDWDSCLLKPPIFSSYYHKRVYIPGARGGQPSCTFDNAMVAICSEEERNRPDTVLTLLSIVRYHLSEQTWDFEGSEEDYTRYNQFFSQAAKRAQDWCKLHYQRTVGDTVPVLAQALLIGSRVLNVENSEKDDDLSLITSMLYRIPEETTLPEETAVNESKWHRLRQDCKNSRQQMLDLLLLQVSARQGGGDKIHSVDASRLLLGISDFKNEWRLSEKIPNISSAEYHRISPHLRFLERHLERSIRERQNFLTSWRERSLDLLGKAPAIERICDKLLDVFDQSVQLGLLRTSEASQETLREVVERFKASNHIKERKKLKNLSGNLSPGATISILGSADDNELNLTSRFLDITTDFLGATREHAKTQIESLGGGEVTVLTRDVGRLLNDLTTLLADKSTDLETGVVAAGQGEVELESTIEVTVEEYSVQNIPGGNRDGKQTPGKCKLEQDASDLSTILTNFQEYRSYRDRAERLSQRKEDLRKIFEKLQVVAARKTLFLQDEDLQGILSRQTEPDPSEALRLLEKVKETFRSDPMALAQGGNYSRLLNKLEDFYKSLNDATTKTWQSYIDETRPRVYIEFLRDVFVLDEDVLSEIADINSEIDEIREEVPSTPIPTAENEQENHPIKKLRRGMKRIRNLTAEFDLEQIANIEVRNFLEALINNERPGIKCLTKDVFDWLRKRNVLDRFYVSYYRDRPSRD